MTEVARILRDGRLSPLAIYRAIRLSLRFGAGKSRALPALRRSFLRVVALQAIGLVAVAALLLHYASPRSAGIVIVVQLLYGALVLPFPYAHLGLVRDSRGFLFETFGPANALTLQRLLYLPSVVGALVLVPANPGLAILAFALYALTAVNDILDGLIARLQKRTSDFGRIYDPICDMFFNSAVAVGLACVGGIPWWLGVMVALRYVTAFVGGVVVYVFRGPYRVRPTLIGKVGALAVGGVVGLAVLRMLFEPFWLSPALLEVLFVLTAVIAGVNAVYLVLKGAFLQAEGSFDDAIY